MSERRVWRPGKAELIAVKQLAVDHECKCCPTTSGGGEAVACFGQALTALPQLILSLRLSAPPGVAPA